MNKLTKSQFEEKLEQRTSEILEYCKAFEIVDDQDYQMADHKVVECKALMKQIKAHHDPIIAAAHQTHKLATSARKSLYDPPDQASKLLGKKMANYSQQRAAEQAEKQRLLDEKAKADHEAACEKEADEAEASGNKEAATALREMKEEAPVTLQIAEPVLISKTKFKTDWEITGFEKNLVPDEYLIVDEAKAIRMIRATKGNIKISGINFKEIQVPIRRGE